MFEKLRRRGERAGELRARDRREGIVTRLAEVPGVAAAVEGEAVLLSGKRLGRRFEASAALRWRIAEACDER